MSKPKAKAVVSIDISAEDGEDGCDTTMATSSSMRRESTSSSSGAPASMLDDDAEADADASTAEAEADENGDLAMEDGEDGAAPAAAAPPPKIRPFRKTGKVLWYNVEREFGYIVPDQLGHRILYVDREQIEAVKDDKEHQALQREEPVEYTLNSKALCAEGVTRRGGAKIDFTQKYRASEGPRFILIPGGPHGGPAPPMMSGPSVRPVIEEDSETFVKGRVVRWEDYDGWGYIQPEGNFRHLVVERDGIEAVSYPGLKVGLRVKFIVGPGPYPNTVTATQVHLENGLKVDAEPPFPKPKHRVEPMDNEVHKGVVSWFGQPPSHNYGFIIPLDKWDPLKTKPVKKEDQVFVHISETNFLPLKQDAEVEYKLGKNDEGKLVAVSVTGPDGGELAYAPPNLRANPAGSGGGANSGVVWGHNDSATRGGRGRGRGRGGVRGGFNKRKGGAGGNAPPPKKAKPKDEEDSKKYQCDVCEGKILVGVKQWKAHCKGKTHVHKKEMSEIESSCTVCNVVFSSKQHRDTHMAGKRHLQNVNPILFAAMYPDHERKRQAYSSRNTFTRHWQQHRHSLVQAGLAAPGGKSSQAHAAIPPPKSY